MWRKFKLWLRASVKRWTANDVRISGSCSPAITDHDGQSLRPQGLAMATVTLREATNGYILELGVYKPTPRGPDWTYTSHILTDNSELPAAVTTLLVQHALNK